MWVSRRSLLPKVLFSLFLLFFLLLLLPEPFLHFLVLFLLLLQLYSQLLLLLLPPQVFLCLMLLLLLFFLLWMWRSPVPVWGAVARSLLLLSLLLLPMSLFLLLWLLMVMWRLLCVVLLQHLGVMRIFFATRKALLILRRLSLRDGIEFWRKTIHAFRPRMLQCLCSRQAFRRVRGHEPLDDVLGRQTQMVPEAQALHLEHPAERGQGPVLVHPVHHVELGEFRHQHHVQYGAERPAVGWESCGFSLAMGQELHLRRQVRPRPDKSVGDAAPFPWIDEFGEPKI